MKSIKICINIIILFCWMQSTALAQNAAIADLVINNTRDHLLLYLNLEIEEKIREKIKESVKSGIPITFSFVITLNKIRNLLIDEEVKEIKVTHIIRYNNIKKEYVIRRSWENNRPNLTESFIKGEQLMSQISSLEIVPLIQLVKGNQYQIKAKAELIKESLPFYLNHILFFLSKRVFKTDWHTINFIY